MSPIDQATTFDLVRFYDPEIVAHNDAAACGRYSIERDMSVLRIPEDAKPIVFRCSALTRDQRRSASALSSEERRYDLAFRFGVQEIINLPDGKGGVRPAPFTHNRSKAYAPLDDRWLDTAGLGDRDVQEIGSAIWGLSFLALGVPPRCVQLDSSLVAYAAAERLCAERKTD